MSGSVINFIQLVHDARSGKLKLPAFQRQFKWNRKQVVLLFDSIRQRFPLGGMIQIEGNRDEFSARTFKGASDGANEEEARRLVLDGQQRITAGMHLFYGKSDDFKSQYFIDLNKLEEDIKDNGINIDDEDIVNSYVKQLDVDSGYCKARTATADPEALLNKSHLLFTPLLLSSNSKYLDTYIDTYLDRYPHRKPLIRNVVKPHFVIGDGPSVPIISIEAEFQLDAVSRIFATLNSTGKVLTPFELVVAVLFPKGIDLRKEIDAAKTSNTYLQNMDKTGEISLQTAVLLAGQNPKKSLLPKNLTDDIWKSHGTRAFEGLESVGTFLTDHLGMALSETSELIPYDSIFAPLAYVLLEIDYQNVAPKQKADINNKLSRWVVGAALSQRYQEGVHNKQKSDATGVLTWLKGGAEPAWLSDVVLPGLRSAKPTGAIGRMVRALINRQTLKDPVNQQTINTGKPNVELHHIFPIQYAETMKGWDKAVDKTDLLLNTMNLSRPTNKAFLHKNPSDQIAEAESHNSAHYLAAYGHQFITRDALAYMKAPSKTREDYYNFIKLRETQIENLIAEFGFARSASVEEVDDEEEA